jgi:hypothetical protein
MTKNLGQFLCDNRIGPRNLYGHGRYGISVLWRQAIAVVEESLGS